MVTPEPLADLLERSAACSPSADDLDQSLLFKQLRDIWQALADNSWGLSDNDLAEHVEALIELHTEILMLARRRR
jgi:hypothetical protein